MEMRQSWDERGEPDKEWIVSVEGGVMLMAHDSIGKHVSPAKLLCLSLYISEI